MKARRISLRSFRPGPSALARKICGGGIPQLRTQKIRPNYADACAVFCVLLEPLFGQHATIGTPHQTIPLDDIPNRNRQSDDYGEQCRAFTPSIGNAQA